ncbi:ATP synthase F0 subunit B [Enterovirga rhinocerotis]|uniref:ATP synthase F0 subunit B n=1 Tax=Enterovirga rhinocerotis TaxID=1339210 RepID=A0A4R7C749_9HYPH|nr:ATP synthase F0 subunit B [Enterovirga rhinocerotis]TDR94218.1 hypothetical protein EV668_1499 [Enterovirga rhinocerotis]
MSAGFEQTTAPGGVTQPEPVDWGAIFAGTVVASGTAIVMTTFASALGMGSISVGPDGGISTIGLALTGLFTVVSMVAAYWLGGYIAGRMRRRTLASASETDTRDGLHGLVVWGLGMLIAGSFALSAISGGARAVGGAASTAVQAAGSAVGGAAQGAGQLAGGVLSGVGQAVGGAARGAGNALEPGLSDMLPQGMQSNPLDYLIDTMNRPGSGQQPTESSDPAAVARQMSTILANIVRTGEVSDADRAYLRDLVANRTGLTQEEAGKRVDEAVEKTKAVRAEAQKRLDEAKAQAARVADEARKTVEEAKAEATRIAEKTRVTGILTAFLLAAASLVAAAAAFIGATWGGAHRDEGRIWKGLSYQRKV